MYVPVPQRAISIRKATLHKYPQGLLHLISARPGKEQNNEDMNNTHPISRNLLFIATLSKVKKTWVLLTFVLAQVCPFTVSA